MTNPRQASGSGSRKTVPPHLLLPPPPPPPQSTQDYGTLQTEGDEEISQGTGTTKSTARANWNHQMKFFLIGLLKQHDLPRFRAQNAWSKEAWTTIVAQFNAKFSLSFTVAQVKQKEQDLKKEYRVVKDLADESGFGLDSNRKMVTASDSVWKLLEQRRNKDALLRWRDKSYPYYDDLYALYDGRYAQGRSCCGIDHYANKGKKSPEVPPSHSPQLHVTEGPLQPTFPTHFDIEGPRDDTNWFGADEFSPLPNHVSHSPEGAYAPKSSNIEANVLDQFQETQLQTLWPTSSIPEVGGAKRGKRQKTNNTILTNDFHERYLILKKEEIDRFAAIEEKKWRIPTASISVSQHLRGCLI
ncbi:unnamed protein product [Urochloa decumbens]|uniref:Myb/SANT-like domain-containing protein n=1 Tax=Urochloa decumbens TaxID=240449 RepID=A0ABC9GG03_9POAL